MRIRQFLFFFFSFEKYSGFSFEKWSNRPRPKRVKTQRETDSNPTCNEKIERQTDTVRTAAQVGFRIKLVTRPDAGL